MNKSIAMETAKFGNPINAYKAPYDVLVRPPMTCWPVSTRVGKAKNNDPSLIEPIAVQ